MVKKIIAIFFLLLFATQSLPVRQVGQFIARGTMIEELPETGSSKSAPDPLDLKWLFAFSNSGDSPGIYKGQSLYIHFSETLPFRLASDVQTPPPNLFC